nr:RNA-directed DNA polymerase, eukaryota, reverse transcriptase zinc-binding domain protein [Tanacetum cinerariifolium]
MESLHLSFQNIINEGMFKGVSISSNLHLSHLFYVDDVVFMGQWFDSNISTIIKVLKCFYLVSGLRINMHKSKLIGITVDVAKVYQAASRIGCLHLVPPFSYLGTKIGGLMSRINSWDEIVNKLLTRLSRWKMKTLSVGGRLTLLKSVLGPTPIYYMSLFKVPLHVIRRMESIRNRFFNGIDVNEKKTSWFSWNKVLASNDKGGLGVSSFYAMNHALMFKWVCRFRTDNTSLWARFIKFMHGEEGLLGKSVKPSAPSIWLDIIRDLNNLKNQGTGEFTVASVRQFIDDHLLFEVSSKLRWRKIVPIKVNILAWKIKINFLPSRLNLSIRGLDIHSILCSICEKYVESTNHITCSLVCDIYRQIASWWDVSS